MTEANPIDRIYGLTLGESIHLNADDFEYVSRKNYFSTEAYDTTSYTTVTHLDGSATITLIKSLTDDGSGCPTYPDTYQDDDFVYANVTRFGDAEPTYIPISVKSPKFINPELPVIIDKEVN